MTADSLQLAASGPDEDEIRIVKDLPRAKLSSRFARGFKGKLREVRMKAEDGKL